MNARHTLRAAQRRWSRYNAHQIRRANRLFRDTWKSRQVFG
jgi:hypothetical protein